MEILSKLDELLDLYVDVGRGNAAYGMTLIELSNSYNEAYVSLTDEEKQQLDRMIVNYHQQTCN